MPADDPETRGLRESQRGEGGARGRDLRGELGVGDDAPGAREGRARPEGSATTG
jgi:hypothetical protein